MKKAFTLAEVLIVLGITGVVAALTIPTLIQKNGILRLSDEYASIAEKGGKLPRTILLNEKENNTNFKKYGVW